MNRKIKFLIISIIIIAGIVLGVNYISNAAVFGDELVNIEKMVGDVVKTYRVKSETSAGALLESINDEFRKMNEDGSGKPEQYISNNVYTKKGIFCVKHQKALPGGYYNCEIKGVNITHGKTYSLYYNATTNSDGKIIFDETTKYGTDPKLKTNPAVWKTVYEADSSHSCDSCTLSDQVRYSNFNAIQIYSGPLHSIETHYRKYTNNYRIPYIISFYDGKGCITSPTDAQDALWGLTGDYNSNCNEHGASCSELPEESLHKAGIAVEQYINVEKSHGSNVTVSIPANAEAGAAYYSRVTQGEADNAAMEEANKGLDGYENPQGHEVAISGMVRIGPFVMSDYAYAFSEDVAKYSNNGLEWDHIIAGIVDGYVTVSGEGDIPIIAKDEGAQGDGALIVYKDWYDQVPYKYNSTSDVRGDASRGYKTTLNGKEHEILYKPVIDNSNGANAGVYTTQIQEKGSKELLSGGNITNTPLKVKVKDDDGNYTVEYPYPLPNSVFYIELPAELCGSLPYSKLESITFTYRTTETSGTGDVIIARAAKSTTKFNKSEYNGDGDVITDATKCSTYHCTDHTPIYAAHDYGKTDTSKGGRHTCYYHWTCNSPDAPGVAEHDCPGHTIGGCGCKITKCGHRCNNDCRREMVCSGGANHVHSASCYKEYCGHSCNNDCYKECRGDHDCGKYCRCEGHDGSHQSLFLCEHGHAQCENGYWILNDSEISTVYGQPILIVNEAKTEVKKDKKKSSLGVPILTQIDTDFVPVFIWHGWDTGFSMDGSFNFITGTSGFFDFSDFSFNETEDIGALAEIGDRITYRAKITNSSGVDLYVWLYIQHAYKIVDDDVTNISVNTNTVGDFFESLVGEGGSFDSSVNGVTPKNMVTEGDRSTRTARILIKANSSYSFYYTYTLTKDVKTYKDSDGTLKSYSPYIVVASKDWNKYKSADKTNIDVRSYNIDFVRKHWKKTPQHEGPVITQINQMTGKTPVKEYVVNINKYIYNVDHIYSNGKTDTSIQESEERGYEFANGTTNLYTLEELKKLNEDTEKMKKDNPVYVEYGDRITYKIEVGNGKISDRKPKNKYDVDKIYVTLVDELPMKYSGLTVTIEDEGQQGEHLKKSIPATSSNNGGTIKLTDLMIPKNGVTTIEVSFIVEEHEKYDGNEAKLHENKAYIEKQIVYNYNRGPGKNPGDGSPLEGLPLDEILDVCDVSALTTHIGSSSDWYVINDYKLDIDKYISSYKSDIHDANEQAGLTDENPKIENKGLDGTGLSGLDGNTQKANEDLQRLDWKDDKKKIDPVQVERTDELIYSIKLENKSVTTGTGGYTNSQKSATQVRVSKIIEEIDPGLEIVDVRAYIYKKNGTKDREVTVTKNPNSWGATRYELTLEHSTKTILDPGEFIVFYVKVVVNESNMSLDKLENKATIAVLTNINTPPNTNANSDSKLARMVKEDGGYNENVEPQQETSEYVRMKDLVIAGKVWLDKDRDGKMEDEDLTLLTDEEKTRFNSTGSMAGKAGVEVRLYKVGETTPLRVTYTDVNGEYTFSKKDDGSWYENSFESSGKTGISRDGKTYQRVDKAEKDEYGNYINNPNSYINYYIEFAYDGVLYKSTELYSRNDYSELNRADEGKTNLTGNGNYNGNYIYDSNAAEKEDVRANFNTKYEYISYNTAYGDGNNINAGGNLKFDKDGHTSLLKEDSTREIVARTFINDETNADNYLWLYKGDGSGGPNTEYLKYINLGLELREEVDIALTKDVYKVKTTINGETMEYDFNQNAGLNGVDSGLGGTKTGSGEYLNDFIIKKAYGLEIYEYDYKYRVDQYFADEVRNYKGIESELNIEVTYRITIDNKAISDADDVIADGKDYVTDNKLKVKVNEIMDVYETNFIKLGARPNDEITIKTKDDNGYLVDTKIKTIEAWYFKEDANGNYKVANDTSSGEKPIYIETATGGTHVKVPLTISANSAFTNNNISYEDYGYNKLYITGMENEDILEDKDLDIYIKYTLDKDETEISVDVSTYEETTTSSSKVLGSAELGDAYGTYTQTIKVNKTTGKATMQRSLKIQDPVTNKPRTNNRYLENIAQVNAYSVWYMDNKPASLVDRNSNVGNLGANGKSPDDISEYDDTTYKTGVEIKVCSSTDIDGGNSNEVIGGQIEISTKPRIERIISGKVWDDSRTTTLGSGNEVQYIGDGVYDESIPKQADALMNENVELNYEGAGTTVTEEKDFPIRNVKAEFIEIVKMPDPSGTGERYYEQVLQQVTWKQVQNTRTASDGTYELLGFIPGTYIVRFTYGDTATGTAEKDMQIFNGQDYKSTQYNSELSDNETDIDKILAILEKVGKSDARDDERRRLEVNSYSEVMTNAKAEILKGVGNGTRLTPNSTANTADELKELTDKTYMQSETVEFLVKAEKLTEEQQGLTKYLSLSSKALGIDEIFYSELQAIQKEERDTRDFKITNIDLGIEYRPESEIRLVKEIEEVKLITEDGNTLVDLFFLTEGENENTTHKIDTTKSKGLEVVQFITNTYTNELLNRLTNEKKQGFIFVQVDEEVLQGCTVQISYKFEAENNSEVDRIAVNLDEIRYKENPEAIKLIAEYPKVATQAEGDYTASAVAAKVIESDMYRTVTQDGVEIEYRLRPKTVVTEGLSEAEEKEAYFGRYVGYGYYTGKESNLDTIASLKFDKILDYVDVNLEYKQESEQSNTIDKFWTRVKTNDLKTLLYQVRTSTENPVAELQNGRGYDYKTLIVSVDDRIKDDKYSTRYSSFKINSETDNIRNNDLSRFLLPKVTVENEAEEDKAVATIRLPVSKVLSAETDKDNMSYENFAEIVQFTTLTGRRTNFATTIGNADIEKVTPNERKGTLEFVTASLESDTAATETVTLIPPTGLMKNRLAIVNIVEATSVGVGFIFILGTIAVILIIIITAILFIIRKYKKRRII